MSTEEKIQEIEEEIRKTPYNKATQHHIGLLKAKLASLREKAGKSGGGGGGGYSIKKSGDSTAVLVGLPSVGKSTLLNQLTNANSKVGSYQFTTLDVVPGAMHYKDANIQIFDLPGIITGASGGRGKGREVLSVARNADLVIIVMDVFSISNHELILRELHDIGIRLNSHPPDVIIKKRSRGGVNISSTVKLKHLDKRTIAGILGQFGTHNADVLIREAVDADGFIDCLSKNRIYIPGIVILNKVDLITKEGLAQIEKKIKDFIPVSADSGLNLDILRESIFRKLRLMRIYMRPQGKEADMETPLVVRKDSSVSEVCKGLHKDFKRKFRYAMVWGDSAKFAGQKVGLDHRLKDKDILTIVVKR